MRLQMAVYLRGAAQSLLVADLAGRSAEKLDGVNAGAAGDGDDRLLCLPMGIASGESRSEDDETRES